VHPVATQWLAPASIQARGLRFGDIVMKSIFSIALAAFLAMAATPGYAVYLNGKGLGQVMVYPYYTANGNNSTLLSIINTTASGKALKVRFHEGYDGRGVLDFNVYLAPYASWAGEVGNRGGADAPASIITRDLSCTVPAFAPLAGSSGAQYLDFSDASYAGTNASTGPTGNSDGGPVTADRTREGHFDVIEMGEVGNASRGSLSAISPSNGIPSNCAQIVNAWSSAGYWSANPNTDISPPAGGIVGSEAVIDVEQGTMYGASPEAIGGFSSVAQHTAPGAAAPDLNTASASGSSVAAFVNVNGQIRELDYQNPVDAISALFMSSVLINEFNVDPDLGALSDWIVTAPTKRYYVDPAFVGKTAAAPFDISFSHYYSSASETMGGVVVAQWASSYPYSCVNVDPVAYNSAGASNPIADINPGGPFNPGGGISGAYAGPSVMPCLETSVLTFSVNPSTGAPISALGSELTNASDPSGNQSIFAPGGESLPPFSSGYIQLDLVHDINGNTIAQHQLSAATNGDVLLGLPVTGFLAENYINANVTPGVLANYSGVYQHRASVACANSAAPQGVCP
jgi:hypothetical protein